ncbi:MAG TPA: tetratricopeptide repeat protein [Thermoanaerobaculia bacterium]|nr:tetratricopeptide repeat protein [Thermoanaerobaculia bacterium]
MTLPEEPQSTDQPEQPPVPPSSEARLLVTIAAVLLIGCGVIAYVLVRSAAKPEAATEPAAQPVAARASVAVIGFENLNNDPELDWLSTAIADKLSSLLADGEKIRTVDGERIAAARRELAVQPAADMPPEALAALAETLQTDYLVSGSYSLGEENDGRKVIRLDVRLRHLPDGRTDHQSLFSRPEMELFQLVTDAASPLRRSLQAPPLTPERLSKLSATLASNRFASEHYARGLDLLRSGRPHDALPQLRRAMQSAPDSPLTWSALARASWRLGLAGDAIDAIARARELDENLPPRQRINHQLQEHEIKGERQAMIDLLGQLSERYPDERRQFELRLAGLLIEEGRTTDATLILERLAGQPPAGDPRLTLLQAAISGRESNHERQRTLAYKALGEARKDHATRMVAEVRIQEAIASAALDDFVTALDAIARAERIFEHFGDEPAAATTLQTKGSILRGAGRTRDAIAAIEQSIAIGHRIGHRGVIARGQETIGEIHLERGNRGEAKRWFRSAMATDEEARNPRGGGSVAHRLALIALEEGDRSNAGTLLRQASLLLSKGNDSAAAAGSLEVLAGSLYESGRLADARSTWQEALHLRREIADRRTIAPALLETGKMFLAEGNIPRARSSFDEIVIIQQALRDPRRLAEGKAALASILLEQGRGEQAAAALQPVVASLEQTTDIPRRCEALRLLAEALLASGDVANAAATIDKAVALQQESPSPRLAITRARIVARGEGAAASKARSDLESMVTRLRESDNVPLWLEARLALAEVAHHQQRSEAQGMLRSVERDALQRGFSMMAQRAAALRGGEAGKR